MFCHSDGNSIMNKIILNRDQYTFNPSTKVVSIDFSVENVTKEFLLLITNVTDNKIIYNFGCEGYGCTIFKNSITLEYDTTSMSSTDDLQIILYTSSSKVEESTLDELETQTETLSCLQEILTEVKKQTIFIKEIIT